MLSVFFLQRSFHLLFAEEDGQGFVGFGREDAGGDVFADFALAQEELIERAQGGQFALDGPRRLVLFLQQVEHPFLDVCLVDARRVVFLGRAAQEPTEVPQVVAIGFDRTRGVLPLNGNIV